MNKIFLYIFNSLLLLILGLSSCDENKFDIALNNNHVIVNWLRLERDFTGLATQPNFNKYNDSLIRTYGSFYNVYTKNVMNLGYAKSLSFEEESMRFLLHKDIHELYMSVDSSFHDISTSQKEIEQAFSYYHYYFPEKKIPVIVSMVTGISNNIVVTDSVLAVGLDMYLGDSSYIYKLAGIPEYLRRTATPDYIAYDMLRGWVLSEFEPKNKKDDVLSQIINYGKSMYLMDALFPFSDDYLKMGYLPEEIVWCKKNEVSIWTRLIEKQQLYSTDMSVIRGLTGPGPFSTGFSTESPSQIGYWVGWQIVKKYMDNNPQITINELMNTEDAQTLLRLSKYKPR